MNARIMNSDTPAKQQDGRVAWVDFIRVVGIWCVVIFHMRCGTPDQATLNFFVVPVLIFFLFFMGFFTRWDDSAQILTRLKWVVVSYAVWGLISSLTDRPEFFFGITHVGDFLQPGFLNKVFTRFIVDGQPGWDNWSFWFLRAMLVFYATIGGVTLIKKYGYRTLPGVFGCALLVCVALIMGAATKALWSCGAFYLPLIGMLIRKHCDIETLTMWIQKLTIPALIAYASICCMLVTSERGLPRFFYQTLPGFMAICGLGIGFQRVFPRTTNLIARMAPAVFLVFISHMLLVHNFAWSLLKSPLYRCAIVALLLIVTLYALARLLNAYCPILLQILNCGNLVRRKTSRS